MARLSCPGVNLCMWVCLSLVWTDGVSKQHAVEMADLALGVCSGGRFGHQPQQSHLHVSLTYASATCLRLELNQAIDQKHFVN